MNPTSNPTPKPGPAALTAAGGNRLAATDVGILQPRLTPERSANCRRQNRRRRSRRNNRRPSGHHRNGGATNAAERGDRRARGLNWKRRVDDEMQPGMSPEGRKRRVEICAHNLLLPQIAAALHGLEDIAPSASLGL
jgi:hypothetical protein